MSYDVTRHRAMSRLIVRYLCNSRATTSYDFICDRKPSSRIVRHRTTVIRSSYDHPSEVVCHRTTIVRLSYDLPTISQTLPMRRKPTVSSVTTKLRLQYSNQVGIFFRNLRCRPSHDVAARCDQGFIHIYKFMPVYIACESHNITFDSGSTSQCDHPDM